MEHFEVVLPKVGRFSLYRRKLPELLPGTQPRTSGGSTFKQLQDFTCSMLVYPLIILVL